MAEKKSPDGVIPEEWKSGYTLNEDNPVIAAAGGYQNFREMLGLPPGEQGHIPLDDLFTPPTPPPVALARTADAADSDELLGDGLDELDSLDLQPGGTRDVTRSPQHHKLQLDNFVGDEDEEEVVVPGGAEETSSGGSAQSGAPPPPPPPPAPPKLADPAYWGCWWCSCCVKKQVEMVNKKK